MLSIFVSAGYVSDQVRLFWAFKRIFVNVACSKKRICTKNKTLVFMYELLFFLPKQSWPNGRALELLSKDCGFESHGL